VGARTDAARAEVLARRIDLGEEIVRLEASARAAVDIPARVRRAPAKAASLAAGAAFLVAGGPGRVVRGLRRAVFGPQAELPSSMLPDEVDKILRRLGSDGERVRGILERDFARYMDEQAPARRDRDLVGTLSGLAANLLRPASVRAGRQLAERLFDPDGPSFAEGLRRARARAAKRTAERAGEDPTTGGATKA